MKTIYFFLGISFFCFSQIVKAQSPDWLWAKGIGGTYIDAGLSICTDASGNVYTTGEFSDTVDFDPGPGVFNLIASGFNTDIFLSKFDSSGNFIWAKSIGGNGADVGNCMTIDAYGNIYTAGNFTNTVDFDPGAGTFNMVAGIAYFGFILKLDSTGNFIWAKSIGGFGSAYPVALSLDLSGNVYSTGYFGNTVDFDPGPGIFRIIANSEDIFISKLDSAGNFIWAKAMGGSGSDRAGSLVIDQTGNGNIYTTGYFQATADFDPDTTVSFNLTAGGNGDIFVSKLDSSGNFVWAGSMGGSDYDIGSSITLDATENVYVTGDFIGTADFDPDAGTANLISAGSSDIFILKLNDAGNFVWAKRIGGFSGDFGRCILHNKLLNGGVYATGFFNGTVDFNPNGGISNLSAVTTDIFILKLDDAGNFVWAKAIGGSEYDYRSNLALNSSGNFYLTGEYKSPTINFGTTNLTNADNATATGDIFIAKLDTESVIGIDEIGSIDNMFWMYPNPTSTEFSIVLPTFDKSVEIIITDITGKIVHSSTATGAKIFEVNNINSGIYIVHIRASNFIANKKLVVK